MAYAPQVGDEVALSFVKVLDEITLGLVDDDEPVAEAKVRPCTHRFGKACPR